MHLATLPDASEAKAALQALRQIQLLFSQAKVLAGQAEASCSGLNGFEAEFSDLLDNVAHDSSLDAHARHLESALLAYEDRTAA